MRDSLANAIAELEKFEAGIARLKKSDPKKADCYVSLLEDAAKLKYDLNGLRSRFNIQVVGLLGKANQRLR